MNKETMPICPMSYVPVIDDSTVEELATLYNSGDLKLSDIPEDIVELLISDNK